MPDIVGPVGRWWARLSTWQKWGFRLLALVVALLAPANSVGRIMAPSSDWKTILFNPIGIYILLALGLNVVVGLAGLLDLGYVAFFAVGSYTFALLAVHHLTFWLLLPIGIVFAALAGVILGAPTLRLRGDYLAIVTLGFGEIVRRVAINSNWMGGPRGVSNIPHPPSIGHIKQFTYGVLDPKPYYYLVLAAIVLVIFIDRRLERSRVGRAWQAIREDEDAAELMGVPTFKFKLWAFAIGASIGGMAGRDLRLQADRHHARQLPVPPFGADPGRGGARRLRQRARSHPRRLPGGLAARVPARRQLRQVRGPAGRSRPAPGPGLLRPPGADLRRAAGGDDDLPARGPAAVPAAAGRAEGRSGRHGQARVRRSRSRPSSRKSERRRAEAAASSFEGLTVRFGGVVAISELDLQVNEGEIFALIGPNGAGKTTAFNIMTGVYKPTEGQVLFADIQPGRQQAPPDHPPRASPARSRTSGCSAT